MTACETKERFSAVRLLVELCPLPIFLIAYLIAPGPEDQKIFFATWAFIAATVGATSAKIIIRPVRTLSWVSASLVVILGGLTLWLRDETFIKMKPTLYGLAAAAMTGFALLTGRPWMQRQFDSDRHLSDVDDAGRRRMAYVVIAMALTMAGLNEWVWRNTSTLFWIGFQIWGGILVFVLFAAAGAPVMSRHWSGQCKIRTAE